MTSPATPPPTVTASKLLTRRRRPLLLAMLGAVIAAILGGGLLGAITDAVRVQENTIQSGEVELLHDVKVALYDHDAQSCPDPDLSPELLSDGPIPGFVEEVDLAVEGSQVVSPIYCIYNLGPRAGSLGLLIDPDSVQDVEVDCSPGEAEIGGDDTCGEGGDGELIPILGLWYETGSGIREPADGGDIVIPAGERGVCSNGSAAPFQDRIGVLRTFGNEVAPGEFCTFRMAFYLGSRSVQPLTYTHPSVEELAAAQSDRVDFEFHFLLQD